MLLAFKSYIRAYFIIRRLSIYRIYDASLPEVKS